MKKIYLFQATNTLINPYGRYVVGALPYFPEQWENIPHDMGFAINDTVVITFHTANIWHDFESDCMVTYADMEKSFKRCKEYTACENVKEYIEASMDYNNGALEDVIEYMRAYCADAIREYYSAYEDDSAGGYFHE